MPKSCTARNYCFTWYSWPDKTWANILECLPHFRYLVGGEEICPTTSRPHIQGYIEFLEKTDSTVLTDAGVTHVEPRKKSAKAASAYCKKDNKNIIEIGTMSQQGKRSDLAVVAEDIKSGRSIKQVAEDHPETFIRFHKGITALKMILIKPRNSVPNVTILYGPTGTGKSKLAREITTDAWIWTPMRGQWFDHYEGQSDVIFEEFRGQFPLGMLLIILDRYDCPVQYKGGTVEFAATNIVITSPKHPANWYRSDGTDRIEQLFRRVTRTLEITTLGVVPISIEDYTPPLELDLLDPTEC